MPAAAMTVPTISAESIVGAGVAGVAGAEAVKVLAEDVRPDPRSLGQVDDADPARVHRSS